VQWLRGKATQKSAVHTAASFKQQNSNIIKWLSKSTDKVKLKQQNLNPFGRHHSTYFCRVKSTSQ